MESELLYIEEHLSCQNYMTTIETGFKFIEFTEDTEFGEDNTNKNYLLFFLKGDITISYNQFHNKPFQTGDMILIPRSSLFKGVAPKESKLLLMFSIYRKTAATNYYYNHYQIFAKIWNTCSNRLKYVIR